MKRKLSTASPEVGLMSDEVEASGPVIKVPKKAKSQEKKNKRTDFPHNFLIMTTEQKSLFDTIRSEAKDQAFIAELLENNTPQYMKAKLWNAFKNSYKVDVDYRTWAKQRDSSDPESSTFTAQGRPGPLRTIIRSSHSAEKEFVQINEREGMILEGDNGVPLLILLTSVEWQGLKDEMKSAGANFSNTYKFHGSNPRSHFRDIEDSPFTSGYVKHSVGWATGHFTTRAMIHNDVIQDHAPADPVTPVKDTTVLENKVALTPTAKQQLKTKNLAVEKAKQLNRVHAKIEKYSALSPRDLRSAECWDKLFDTANKALHLVNIVLEYIDPEFALSCHELSTSLKNDINKYGHHLSRNECHLPGVAFHWNVDAKAVDHWHTDANSACGGWDAVISNGPNNARFEVREIGVSIDFREGDLLLLRGAALTHRAGDWSGKGRFMTVPFCDRRLFNAQRVGGKMTMPALYGSKWAELRHKYWYKPFPGSEPPVKPKKSSHLRSKVQ